MKAKELMIGDWVEYRFTGWTEKGGVYRDYEYVKISTIGDLYVKADNDRVASEYGKIFYPIPLTPEILEKNGWEERKEQEPFIYYLLKRKDYSISLSKEWDSTTKTIYWSLSIGNHITDATLSVNYIHQLQHALRLCGIEKEIEL